MTREQRYEFVIDYFRRTATNVGTELQFGSAFQLLVATLLSAQCTDKRINEVTPPLFERYPTPQLMAQAEPEDILEFIHSVSYPNAKARHLVDMARMLVNEFGGVVPDNVKELTMLPGVGRKTANVLQAVWFGKAAMAVDTHVYRVAHRLGLVPKTANISEDDIPRAHHWLLLHGRYVCKSSRPQCDDCPFTKICPKLMEGSKLQK